MKKRNLIAFSVILVLLCNFLGVSKSGAWFVSGGSLGDGNYQTAQVVYLPALQSEAIYEAGVPFYGRLIGGSVPATEDSPAQTVYLIPGESLIDTAQGANPSILSMENFSTVPTNVRVRIQLTLDPDVLDESGNVTSTDDFIANGVFVWKQVGNTSLYQYGMDYAYTDAFSVLQTLFMPLLEVNFASAVTVGDTVVPDAHIGTGGNMAQAYHWSFSQDASAWMLRFGTGQGSLDIPADTAESFQFMNVITSFQIASDITDGTDEEKSLFNEFFSNHYANHNIKIQILYEAKQAAEMQWNQFSADHMELVASRTDATYR